jgi:hypothetical protein
MGVGMNPFTGPVFSLPDGLGGVTWHQWHGTFNASVRITGAEAAIYVGGRAFARMAFARLRSTRATTIESCPDDADVAPSDEVAP